MMPLTDLDRIDQLERDEALAALAETARQLLRQRDALLAAAKHALEQINACDCSNGVTSPMGDIDQGDVYAVRTMDLLREAIAAAEPKT